MLRSFINNTVPDMESIFRENYKNRDVMEKLKEELALRSSSRAKVLHDEVDKILSPDLGRSIESTSKDTAAKSILFSRLKPLREKLIDVSLRSRLLNYRDLGSQTLPLLPCDLDTLYQWLVSSEKELEVKGVTKSEQKNEAEDEPKTDAEPKPARPCVDFTGEDATRDIQVGILRSRDSMLKTENLLLRK